MPDQRRTRYEQPRLDVPCAVYSIDTRWPFAASVPVDSDRPYEVDPSFEGPAHRVNTSREGVYRIACLDGLAEVEVVSPSRLVLMESFRSPVEEDPLRAYVSKRIERRRRRQRRRGR